MIDTCAEACSAVIEAIPPSTSDLIDVAEECRATRVAKPCEGRALLTGGCGARLVPLCRVPLDGGVFGELLSGLSAIAGGGDLDFPLDSDDPVAPITPEAGQARR